MKKNKEYMIKHLKGNTYFFEAHTNVGIYKLNDEDVCLIDTGEDEDTAEIIAEQLDEREWYPKLIINTHAHPDHSGGNALFQDRYESSIYATDRIGALLRFPELLPDINFGSASPKRFRNQYYMARPSIPDSEAKLPEGFRTFNQDGHAFGMIGVITPDNVAFPGDGLNSKGAMKKHKLFYNYDIGKAIEAYELLDGIESDIYVPSHGTPIFNRAEFRELVKLNIESCNNNIEYIRSALDAPMSFEVLLNKVIREYQPVRSDDMHYVISVTLKSYLSYMIDLGIVRIDVSDNNVIYQSVESEIK